MSTLLVTGGAGFIGSAVVRKLVRETGHRVVNVDKLTYAGNLESLDGVDASPRYAFEQVDIADAAAVRDVFDRHRPDGQRVLLGARTALPHRPARGRDDRLPGAVEAGGPGEGRVGVERVVIP